TTDTTDTTSETDTTDTTGSTAPDPSCPSEAPSSGDWLFGVDGDFPDDVPTDVDESCSVLVGAQEGELALGCPFGNLALSFYLDPAPSLPAPGTTAQLRLHHEPGWLLWPNIWISVDVDGGDLYGLQSSSVLYPVEGDYEVPGEPSVAGICGPFLAADPFLGEDPCGPQVGQELVFVVDGEEVAAWHASHVLTSVAGRDFEVWANTAREYQAVPETCDVAPLFYSLVTRRQR
ncbi:MAG: hypothetical protein KC431_25095, partial [Myxococcales bacterium]|nr:hypothetical protein [Myxococcales bacterium]